MRHPSRYSLSSVAAAIAAVAIAAPSPAVAAPTDGLVGYWPLNDATGAAVRDVSGYGNDGVLSGDAAWVTTPFGGGLAFGPGTGQVEVSDAPSLEPPSAVTVGAWVEHLGSSGDYRAIVAKGATGCIAASYGLYTGPDGGLEFYVSRSQGTAYARSADAGQGVWDGRWHLAVGTFDGNSLRLFVDGQEVGQPVAYPGTLSYRLSDSNNLYIGNYPLGGNPGPNCLAGGFVGSIDAVRVWNRALAPGEIAALAPAAGQGLAPSAPQAPAAATSPIGGVSVATSPPQRRGARHPVPRTRDLLITYVDSQGGWATLILYRLVTVPGCTVNGPHRRAALRLDRRRCTRSLLIGRFTHRSRRGRNSVRIPLSRLRQIVPGRYRLVITLNAGRADARSTTVLFSLAPGLLHVRVHGSGSATRS